MSNCLPNLFSASFNTSKKLYSNSIGLLNCLSIILKTKEFQVYCEKVNLELPTNFEFEISEAVFPILDKLFDKKILYRSIGVLLENFNSNETEQMVLFANNERREKNEKLAKSLDKLEAKFGRNIVRTGFVNKEVPYKQDFLTKGSNKGG